MDSAVREFSRVGETVIGARSLISLLPEQPLCKELNRYSLPEARALANAD